jgi:hypothetical protein
MLARETDGTAPMYLPVRVSCRVQPEPDEFTSQVSVPWPMSTTLPPSVRHAPLLTLQMVKAPPEAASLNCCQGFGGLFGYASAAGGQPTSLEHHT